MRIEDDTLVFRSDIRFFGAERDGFKPNTARLLSYDELADFRQWQGVTHPQKIRIEKKSGSAFTREIVHICEAGELLGQYLVIISWRHIDD